MNMLGEKGADVLERAARDAGREGHAKYFGWISAFLGLEEGVSDFVEGSEKGDPSLKTKGAFSVGAALGGLLLEGPAGLIFVWAVSSAPDDLNSKGPNPLLCSGNCNAQLY
jgi:hypothetical protein